MPEQARQQLHQTSFPGLCPVEDGLGNPAAAGMEERGAVFTRCEVVEFILDLLRYTPDKALYKSRLLEPSFGKGDFLLIVIERLLASWRRHGSKGKPFDTLRDAIRAVEIHENSFDATRERVITLLVDAGISKQDAARLVEKWLTCGDFLLAPLSGKFDYIVGNPPYVRQELIPDALITAYRQRYDTIFDRADLYIPFIERSLTLLSKKGVLGFICADRWMKNRYGRQLRKMVAERFHLKIYVDMVNTPAFHAEVIAYPAITVIANEKPGRTRIARRPDIDRKTLRALSRQLLATRMPASDAAVREFSGVAVEAEPWILESPDQLALVRRLESEFPLIEETGCKVGIGVATGADNAYIGPYEELDVEQERKLPLVMTRDILSGEVQWRGLGIVNPFADEGGLVDLLEYPRLRAYLEARKDQIARRHVARRAPENWYRTIDRIHPALAGKSKLLIPDIKGEAHIVYEDGKLYPHHNLYFITSDVWDLKVLQIVLQSGIARLFVSIYSTRMRGGYLRFQAQYLRRIRLPHWNDVPTNIRSVVVKATERGDRAACNDAIFRLYRLDRAERAAIGGTGKDEEE